MADWVLWVFFANGKIVGGGFSLITLIKIFFFFPSLYYSLLKIDLIYLTLFHVLRFFRHIAPFIVFLMGLQACQKHSFSLPELLIEIRMIVSTRITSSLITILLIQVLFD